MEWAAALRLVALHQVWCSAGEGCVGGFCFFVASKREGRA